MSCEYVLWHGDEKSVWFPAEPFASVSGLFMCFLALFGPPGKDLYGHVSVPVEYWLANASLFLCGMCTFLYHALDSTDYAAYGVNVNIFDYVSMAFVVGFTSLLFMDAWMQHWGSYLLVVYFMFAAYSNDYLSFAWLMNKTQNHFHLYTQYPAFVVPYVCMFVYIVIHFKDWYGLFVCILVGLTAWVIDAFYCQHIPGLAFGHTVWHVSIGYASTLFMCYGLRKRGFELEGAWLPRIKYKMLEVSIGSGREAWSGSGP